MKNPIPRFIINLLSKGIWILCCGFITTSCLEGAENGGVNTPDSTTGAIKYDITTAKSVAVVNVNEHLSLDGYGGSKTISRNATGWFSTQKINGRWWLVTPDGHGMVSLGVVHILPGPKDSIIQGAYGGKEDAYVNDVADNIKRWGFNTAGYGAMWKSRSTTMATLMPTMVSLEDLLGISRFSKPWTRPDLFDPTVQQALAGRIAEHVNPVKDSKNLIGYFYVDMPLWWNDAARKTGNDWGTAYRQLKADSAGKSIYVDFLLERHNKSVDEIKKIYGTNAVDRAGLLAETAWTALKQDDLTVTEDDKAFVPVVARQYYMLCHQFIRSLDPNHLIFGDRYSGNDLKIIGSTIKEAVPYVDVISIQPSDKGKFDTALYDEIAQATGKPILFCDFAVNFTTPEYPKVMWTTFSTEDAAADAYASYLNSAFATSYMIGIHRCTYIDLPRTDLLKEGLVRQDGTPYEQTVKRYSEIHRKLYESLYNAEAKKP